MASPIFLGELGSTSDSSGSVTSLVITTTIDVPANEIIVVAVIAGYAFDGSDPTFDPSTINDDVGNTYFAFAEGGNNSLSYDVGRPGPGPLGQRRTDGDGTPPSGCIVALGFCLTSADTPAGTTVTVPLAGTGPDGGNFNFAAGQALGFTATEEYQGFSAQAAGQLIDPTDTSDETGANVPLGDHPFSDIDDAAFPCQLICLVAAQGPTISGTGTIDDPSDNWTKVDGGSFPSYLCEWGLFVVDCDLVDQSQAFMQFSESGSGTAIASCWTICPVVTVAPSPPTNYPVFGHQIRATD